MNTNKTVKKATKKIKKIKRQVKRQRRQVRRARRQVRTRIRRLRRGVNQAKLLRYRGMKEKFKIEKSRRNTMVVSGTDLVYKVPDVYLATGHKIIAIIPCNPAYWKGTRISTLTTCYQQYKPLKFTVHYNPTLSALDRGVVFGGAITSGNSISAKYLEQTLATAPGNMNTQVAKQCTVTVPLGDALAKKLFYVSGDLNQQTNPFYYVGVAVGNFNQQERITPGYFWISYKFLFKNPLVTTTNFFNSGLTTYNDMSFKTHTTLLTCEPFDYDVESNDTVVKKEMNYFSQLQIDRGINNTLLPTYQNTFIPLKPETKVWIFQSEEVTDVITVKTTVVFAWVLIHSSEQPYQSDIYTAAANSFVLLEYKDPFMYRLMFVQNKAVSLTIATFSRIWLVHPTQIDTYSDIPWDLYECSGNFGLAGIDNPEGQFKMQFVPGLHENMRLFITVMPIEDDNRKTLKLTKDQIIKTNEMKMLYIANEQKKLMNSKFNDKELKYEIPNQEHELLDDDYDYEDEEEYDEIEDDKPNNKLPQKNENL